eukprot:3836347-Ditylum_brightwellii.AAC.1
MMKMWKESGKKATTAEENTEMSVKHLSKAFNIPDLQHYVELALHLIPLQQEFTFIGSPNVYNKLQDTIIRMANSKSPDLMGVTLDACCMMGKLKVDAWRTGNVS